MKKKRRNCWQQRKAAAAAGGQRQTDGGGGQLQWQDFWATWFKQKKRETNKKMTKKILSK